MDSQIELNVKEIILGLGNLNQRFSDKIILLTGAAGFLGSQFVHYFSLLNESGILKKPCHLYAWDNYLRGIPDWMDELNHSPNITLQNKDIM